jgi:flagellar biosynthesis GTPase FlhF
MQDYRGKILHFDEAGFNAALKTHEPVLKAINKVSEAYEALDTSFEFNDAVFRDIQTNKCTNIKQQYSDLIERQIEASKFTSKAIVQSMRSNVSAEIEAMELAVEEMFQAQHQAGLSNYSNIRIAGGKAVLSDAGKEILRKMFEEKITTEVQNIFLNHAVQLGEAYETLHKFLREHNTVGANQYWPIIGNHMNSFFDEDGYGKLLMRKNILNFIK